MNSVVQVVGLNHRYAGGPRSGAGFAVRDVSFEVAEGEFFALLGPSGCGKTTTLRCIAGLERPSSGTIRLNGDPVVEGKRSVPTHRRDIGMVFQDYAVWPHMTVYQNVAFPLTIGRTPRKSVRPMVEAALAMVGLDHLADRAGTQLSGGQQQRLSLARALVRKPAVLLLDEPLSNLDAALRERMRGELRQIQQEVRITTVLVTHDQVEALSMATRIALMKDGEVVQIATPRELYERPVNRFAAEFVGAGTFYDATVLEIRGDTGLLVETSLGRVSAVSHHTHAVGDKVSMAIRPEDVAVHDTPPDSTANVFPAEVRNVLYLGGAMDLHLQAGGVLLRAQVPVGGRSYAADDSVYVALDPSRCVVVA
jgi:iron(III) transport system ATP-binding protein